MSIYLSSAIVMIIPTDRILLYQNRSAAQCVETTFDFLRANGRIWLLTSMVLLLPPAMIVSLSVFIINESLFDNFFQTLPLLFEWYDAINVFFFAMLLVGGWMTYVHAYSLVAAYQQHGDAVNEYSPVMMIPFFLPMARRSWWLALALLFLLSATNLGGVVVGGFLMVFMVPLGILPPAYLIERQHIGTALRRAMSLGFSSWFQIAFTICLLLCFGMALLTVTQLPMTGFKFVAEIIAPDFFKNTDKLILQVISFGFASLFYWGVFMVVSIVLLGCAFQYGSVADRVEAASVEGEIENFERL